MSRWRIVNDTSGNFGTVTLDSSYTAGSGAMALTAGHGARLPSSGDYWLAHATTGNIVKVTARSTDALTVSGGRDGSTDQNIASGETLRFIIGREALEQWREDQSYVNTYANIPSSVVKGDLFLPSDGVALYRDNGSAYEAWGPLSPFVHPKLADFTWVNQSTSTGTDTYGGIMVKTPASSGRNKRVLKYNTAWASGKVWTVAFTPLFQSNTNVAGIYVGDGTKMVNFEFYSNTGTFLNIEKLSGVSGSSGGTYLTKALQHGFPSWFRIRDDTTNLNFEHSLDGQEWMTMYSVSRTDYLTPSECGLQVESLDSTFGGAARFYHAVMS